MLDIYYVVYLCASMLQRYIDPSLLILDITLRTKILILLL